MKWLSYSRTLLSENVKNVGSSPNRHIQQSTSSPTRAVGEQCGTESSLGFANRLRCFVVATNGPLLAQNRVLR